MADTIATALQIRVESMLDVLDVITEHLRDRTVLLVIDNFEQVLAGAGTVGEILRAAPRVRGLVTSRAPLAISGEREILVPPLDVPDPDGDPAALRESEAVALFAERAAFVDPGFALTDETIRIVAAICGHLDGLPLAIELAASRTRVLPPRSLLEQLDRRLPMLVGGPRDAPTRQQTLRAAIAWSHDLLDERDRAFFRRLSVFAGGFTLEAAAEVADPEGVGDAVDLVEILLQQSLIRRVSDGDDGRFRMLETIREFGVERLDESGEADRIRERHARRFVSLAEEAEPHLTTPDQRRWMDVLSGEHDNLRAALRWAIEGDEGETALRLGTALWRFWYGRGHLAEGRRWLDAALTLPSAGERSRARARCLTALGGIAYWQSDFEPSDDVYREALEIYRELGEPGDLVEALFNLAMTRGVTGEPETAMSLLQQSLGMARELGDRRGEAWALWGLAAGSMFGGQLEASQKYGDESFRLFEELGTDTWGLGNALAGQAGLAAMRGDPQKARDRVLRSIDVWEDQGNALVIASQLRFLAIAANGAGHPERAVRLAAVAEALREKVGGKVPDAFFPFDDPRETAAKVLDAETVERAWAEGSAMSLEEALAYAREEDPAQSPS